MPRTTSFLSNSKGLVYKQDGYTVDGRPAFSKPTVLHYSPIKLDRRIAKTSIRTDKSGSKSRADEAVVQGRILVHPRTPVIEGSVLKLGNVLWKVASVWDRFGSMDGSLSHYQVDLESWLENPEALPS